ncbi:MAG: endonuclease III [Cohaesibacteraceae bacterium]|nr:endonuclease III [Cohaesibacteraceae bacterium]MBL4875895.1 endonuclease III [Cohaesibacteraceae bacterium]
MKQEKRAKSKIAVRPKPRLPRSKLSVVERAEVFERFSKQRPNPKGELDYSNTYTLLVAVLLSAQATDVGVNKATRHLFQIADTPEKMVALGEEDLRDQVRTIGLYKTKAKNTIAMSKMLIDFHGSEVPNDQQALEALPGVGRKTANVVRNIAFGEPTIAVDTHIFRIGNRVGLAPGKDVVVVENNLARIIPAKFMMHAHHWLILHGRYVCKARTPDCGACIIADLCKFREKTNDLPAPIVELAEYVSR